MLLSSTIEFKKDKIEAINESQKRHGSPMYILDRTKLIPDFEVQKQLLINPVLNKKQVTLEDIKSHK